MDAEVIARFDRAPRQVVLVELRQVAGDDDQLGGPRRAPGADAGHLRDSARAARKEALIAGLGAAVGRAPSVRHAYRAFGMLAIDVARDEADWLASRSDVRRVHADRERRPTTASSVPFMQADAWQASGAKGAGVSVAVLDTPIEYGVGAFGACPSPGAKGCAVKVWESFATQIPTDPAALMAKAHHGTNVAAVVHAVAPEAGLLGLNVFHWDDQKNEPRCFDSEVILALQWVADHAADYPIVAANLSLGSPPSGPGACNDSAYYEPLRVLHHDKNVVATIASGNDGAQDGIGWPGCVSLATTVGAQFDTQLGSISGACKQTAKHPGEVACFSNLGGALDVLAPGVSVTAGGQTYNGTSQAAPHAAGALALLQGEQLKTLGSLESAYWVQKELLAQTEPTPHLGRSFASLRMAGGFHYDGAWGFGGWYKEGDAGAIPKAPAAFTRTIEASGLGFSVESAYLYLEILHAQPEALTVSLTSPTGKLASVVLPAGMANYTGVIGHSQAPGAFTKIAGSPADGTWTVSVADGGGAAAGYFLDAAVYFVKSGCAGACADVGCGDDHCGGSCGTCLLGDVCYADGTKDPTNPCRVCDAAKSATAWTPISGTACDDGDACTKTDSCQSGACVGKDEVSCQASDGCHLPGVCSKATGTCSNPRAKDGTSCDDDDACTKTDTCKAGVCVGHQPTACEAAGPCEDSPSCDPKTGTCVPAPRPDGAGCDDGDLCTTPDTCKAGVCGGPARSCAPKDACHVEGTCSQGTCEDVAAPDGAACPGGACKGGACAPVAQAPRPSAAARPVRRTASARFSRIA